MKRLASPFFCSGDKSAEERGAGGGGVEEEEEEEEEEQGRSGCGKKRRLRTEQVRALERCFEAENKLDPERKARLAHELGLQPRQVAVWFQNRRARWKTKQLERDFAALKSRYDALRLDLDSLRKDNQSLMAELTDLKSRLEPSSLPPAGDAALKKEEEKAVDRLPLPTTLADGPSDSDSSVVMAADESRLEGGIAFQAQQMFRMEEHDFLGGQELCSPAFFSDDHTPPLPWFFCADIAGGW